MNRLELRDVSVAVAVEDAPEKVILESVDVALGEARIAVIGANGSGKSTLLRLLNGLIAPTTGSVTVGGLDTVRDGRAVRQRVGFVFTDPLSQLVMPTGREDVELSLRRHHRDRSARAAAAQAVLERFGLAALADQSVYELSGGERQLMALAAVLAVEPEVLVLDEPSTLLDLRNRELLRRTLAGLPQQVILTTHDLELALDADRVLVVEDGRIAFDGDPAEAVGFYRALCAAAPVPVGTGQGRTTAGSR
ncbi:ABC transporter ATP-binding protein [Sinomonas halotolerans]|uniref:ABC transporter ATP-binding protein n=1 Tax=Sinomonas halotolerans TaxID=1644133 RepID=A0ABU9X2A0_9MICC